MKRIVTPNAPAAIGPYAQGVVTGNLLFVAGQVALTPDGELVASSIEDETRQVMDNLTAILAASDLTMDNVVKTTIYLTDVTLFKEVNRVYGSYFKDGLYPARECVGVGSLPVPNARIEMSMIAELS